MSRLDEVLGTAILKGKKALGKEAPEVLRLPLDLLRVRGQPRRRFENLEALAESIREKGVLQPLLVRRVGEAYEVVAGERRLRAAAMAGLKEVPARVLELSDKEARLLALVENLQREDLNPYEETLGVLALLSEDLGKSVEGVVGLLRKMKNAKEGRVRDNVVPTAEARRVEELFKALGRMSWESFVQHRLPEDLKGSLGGVEGPGGGV
jgi:ParB family chromosome partitioning protein